MIEAFQLSRPRKRRRTGVGTWGRTASSLPIDKTSSRDSGDNGVNKLSAIVKKETASALGDSRTSSSTPSPSAKAVSRNSTRLLYAASSLSDFVPRKRRHPSGQGLRDGSSEEDMQDEADVLGGQASGSKLSKANFMRIRVYNEGFCIDRNPYKTSKDMTAPGIALREFP